MKKQRWWCYEDEDGFFYGPVFTTKHRVRGNLVAVWGEIEAKAQIKQMGLKVIEVIVLKKGALL